LLGLYCERISKSQLKFCRKISAILLKKYIWNVQKIRTDFIKTKWFLYTHELTRFGIVFNIYVFNIYVYVYFPSLSSAWKLREMFPAPFMRLYVARAKSETIIYNVFPPDVWLTPWVNETLASPVCAQNGYLIIHLLLSFQFSFSFYDSTSRRGAGVKRGLWNRGGPTVVQSLGLLCLRLHSLPYHRSDSFHSSAFDHPRRRIRYSNASESAFHFLPTLFRPFRP